MIYNTQMNIRVPIEHSDFYQLDKDQKRMADDCAKYKQYFAHLMSTQILSPSYIFMILSAEHELNIILKKLQLCAEELHYYCSLPQSPQVPRW